MVPLVAVATTLAGWACSDAVKHHRYGWMVVFIACWLGISLAYASAASAANLLRD